MNSQRVGQLLCKHKGNAPGAIHQAEGAEGVQAMKFVFDWHSQDSRATGPLDVANTVTAQYGTGGAMHRW